MDLHVEYNRSSKNVATCSYVFQWFDLGSSKYLYNLVRTVSRWSQGGRSTLEVLTDSNILHSSHFYSVFSDKNEIINE